MLNLTTVLIVWPLVFLAGFVDAIGGGGGLISLPAYLFAGIPIHYAIGTGKLSAAVGTAVPTGIYLKHSKVNWKIMLPAVLLTFIGSAIGARLSLMINEKVLKGLLLAVLPVSAFFVLKKGTFINNGKPRSKYADVIVIASSFLIGTYDGLYGPGTGTFLLIAFIGLAGIDAMEASAMTKVINLTSNVSALITFLIHGQTLILLGLTAALFSIAGNYFGSAMVLKNGTKAIKPIIIVVLVFLTVKIIADF